MVSCATTAQPIEMPFALWAGVGSRNHVLDGNPDPSWKGEIFRGRAVPCKVQGHLAVGCAKTAEPIEMPCGLWARVGSRNHILDRMQIAPCEGAIFRGKDMPGYARRHSVVSCAKMAEPIKMPFELWT